MTATATAAKPVAIYDLLRARYPAKTHALLFEVRDGAGFSANRSCDAIAISTWPSRGLKLMGFEIKASRADWLREVRNPEKSESFFSVCDEWYVLADGKDIVHADEVPETWGWLQRIGNRIVCEKAAPKLAPEPIDRSMLAAMLKRSYDQASAPGKLEFDRGYAAAVAEQKRDKVAAAEREYSEARQLRREIAAFEAASGVQINTYNGAKVGAAMKVVLEGGHKAEAYRIDNMLVNARNVVAALEALKNATA